MLPAGPVRPSGPCCLAVAKAPFVTLEGWKAATTFLVSSACTCSACGHHLQAFLNVPAYAIDITLRLHPCCCGALWWPAEHRGLPLHSGAQPGARAVARRQRFLHHTGWISLSWISCSGFAIDLAWDPSSWHSSTQDHRQWMHQPRGQSVRSTTFNRTDHSEHSDRSSKSTPRNSPRRTKQAPRRKRRGKKAAPSKQEDGADMASSRQPELV